MWMIQVKLRWKTTNIVDPFPVIFNVINTFMVVSAFRVLGTGSCTFMLLGSDEL